VLVSSVNDEYVEQEFLQEMMVLLQILGIAVYLACSDVR
jgi:hypothetical protein